VGGGGGGSAAGAGWTAAGVEGRAGARWAGEDADGGSMEGHKRKTMREVSDKVGPTR